MSDDFIPLNQSTPTTGGRWQNRGRNNYRGHHNQSQNRFQNQSGSGRSYNNPRWGNNSQRNISFGSDSNSSYGQDRSNNIDAYLHPSMLQDPWAQLRKQMDGPKSD